MELKPRQHASCWLSQRSVVQQEGSFWHNDGARAPVVDSQRDMHLFHAVFFSWQSRSVPTDRRCRQVGQDDSAAGLTARTTAQQLGKVVEAVTAPFQCALSTGAGCECVAHSKHSTRSPWWCQWTEPVRATWFRGVVCLKVFNLSTKVLKHRHSCACFAVLRPGAHTIRLGQHGALEAVQRSLKDGEHLQVWRGWNWPLTCLTRSPEGKTHVPWSGRGPPRVCHSLFGADHGGTQGVVGTNTCSSGCAISEADLAPLRSSMGELFIACGALVRRFAENHDAGLWTCIVLPF